MKLTSSIYVGEESGRLETMLTNPADDFDFGAEQASERMVTLIQPIMIIFFSVGYLFNHYFSIITNLHCTTM